MNLTSVLAQRLLRLDPPLTRSLLVQRDLPVPMPDGVTLLADRLAPRHGGEGLPTALLRSPYGRRGLLAAGAARPLAERGFQVLVQSTRGTYGSGGEFDPMRREREDGLATLTWLTEQPWFGDSIVLFGPSYLGFVQWAMADSLPPQVKAMIPQMTESALTLEFLRPDGMSLETPFVWGATNTGPRRRGIVSGLLQIGRTTRALSTVPLAEADVAATGHRLDYVQDILRHDARSARWADLDHTHRVAGTRAPVSSVAGWFDIFLPGQLRDFRILQENDRPARLTIGPWTHTSPSDIPFREAIEYGLAHARGVAPPERAPVRLYVMGEEAWHDFSSWPPEGFAGHHFYLQPDGGLTHWPPPDSEPDLYVYDPHHPTPAVGGIRAGRGAGRVNNDKLESRPDVLTYTTAALDSDVDVIGDVSAQIFFRSSRSHADVFVRLCDVDPRGRSTNVCDGLTGLRDAQRTSVADVRLWPTAYRFRRGHRIRVQVSSGAFPRYARNPGTGESHASAHRFEIAEQHVHHDPLHPSAVLLPMRFPTVTDAGSVT